MHRSDSSKPCECTAYFFPQSEMSTITPPVYKLKGNHAATVGHVRELYTKVVDEFQKKTESYNRGYIDEKLNELLKKDGTRKPTGTLTYESVPIISDSKDIPSYGIVDTMVKERVAKAGDTMAGPLVLSGAPTLDLHASTKKYVDDLGATKRTPGRTMTESSTHLPTLRSPVPELTKSTSK